MKYLLLILLLSSTACTVKNGGVSRDDGGETCRPSTITDTDIQVSEACDGFEAIFIYTGKDTNCSGELEDSEIENSSITCTAYEAPETPKPYFVDPCGDGPGIDQILLVLPDLSVTLSSRNSKVFKTLDYGYYHTRDAQRCLYHVGADGVTW